MDFFAATEDTVICFEDEKAMRAFGSSEINRASSRLHMVTDAERADRQAQSDDPFDGVADTRPSEAEMAEAEAAAKAAADVSANEAQREHAANELG